MLPLKTLSMATLCALIGTSAFAEDCDPEKGKKVFRKCQSCHAVGEGAKSKVGPPLNGIVGAEIALVEGFKYSKPFMERKEAGFVWSEDELDAYLEKPKKHTPKGKMAFAGLRKEQDRADVICYLKTFE